MSDWIRSSYSNLSHIAKYTEKKAKGRDTTQIAIQADTLRPNLLVILLWLSVPVFKQVVEKKETAPSVVFVSKLWKKTGRNIRRRGRMLMN